MEPLKEMFNRAFYVDFARVFGQVYTKFDADGFVADVTRDMEPLSLNGRLRNTSVTLRSHLPDAYGKALDILYEAAPALNTGYTALVLPDFVGLYGKEHVDRSLEALRYFTTFGSSEFAIREFLKMDIAYTLSVMERWAEDGSVHVRRLASEGSRPRLPWSFKLSEIIRQPSLTRGILQRLNTDPELYVRKSVANHLNDHSKDNPAYMLQVIGEWDKTNKDTAWICKHAIRSLIKKGDERALALFGFASEAMASVQQLTIDKPVVALGDVLSFSFAVTSEHHQAQKLVIDYAIHYVKASGNTSRKVFKLKEITLLPGQAITVSKKQAFQDLTTRKHYLGKHELEILVNGKAMGGVSFQLVR